MANDGRLLRRRKTDPDRDALHTLRIGLVIFLILFLGLPLILQ